MVQQYFFIKLTEQDMLRCEKAKDAREACQKAFGTVYDRGQAVYKPIGIKQPRFLSQKRLKELHGPEGWLPIPMG